MAVSKESQTASIAKAKTAFTRQDYAAVYKYCTELMKGKTASVVVYMHCIASLKLRVGSREQVAPMANDALLLTVALDNFYKQSGKKNENIETYISEIMFTLMTTLIESVQKHYPLGNGRRSFKHAVSDAQETMNDIRVLTNYRLSGFTARLPRNMNRLLNETGEKLMAYIGNWVNIVRDPTNNWLYEDDTNDLYERIVVYQTQVNALKMQESQAEEEDKTEDDIKAFVSAVVEKTKPAERNLDEEAPEVLAPDESPESLEETASADIQPPAEPSAVDAPPAPVISRSRKGGSFKPIDAVIGILIVFFILIVSVIIIYAIQPSLILSLFG